MTRQSFATRRSLADDLTRLGLAPGQVVLVHSSMRRLGWVCGGAVTVVDALLDAIGPAGTIAVPTHTADNRDPSRWTDHPVPRQWWSTVREEFPGFDPRITPSHGMGALAEQVRTWPGARRSDHPQTSFAALGPMAEVITSGHALDCHLGDDSPLARLRDLGADVLLLGVGWEVCTAFHLAEYSAELWQPAEYGCAIGHGRDRRWMTYSDASLDDRDFGVLGHAFDSAGTTVRHGVAGQATALRFPLREAVKFALTWMTHNRVHR